VVTLQFAVLLNGVSRGQNDKPLIFQ